LNDIASGAPAFTALTSTNQQFQFTVNGWAGTNYVVPATTNLAAANWIRLRRRARARRGQFVRDYAHYKPSR
jgi:hypothetical protein